MKHVLVVLLVLAAGCEGEEVDVEDSDVVTYDTPEEGCLATGGEVTTSSCCGDVAADAAFPDTCSTGACGCAAEYSVDVDSCACPTNTCFDGSVCVDG